MCCWVRTSVFVWTSAHVDWIAALWSHALAFIKHNPRAWLEQLSGNVSITQRHTNTHREQCQLKMPSLKPVSLCKVIRWKLIILLKDSHKPSNEHCADKSAPRLRGPDGCQVNCYMPRYHQSLPDRTGIGSSNGRFKMDKRKCGEFLLKFRGFWHTWIPDPTIQVNGTGRREGKISVDKCTEFVCVFVCVCVRACVHTYLWFCQTLAHCFKLKTDLYWLHWDLHWLHTKNDGHHLSIR